MKKVLLITLGVVGLSILPLSADDRPVAYNKVPQQARTFVSQHFSGVKVLYSTIDKETFKTSYTVFLGNGIQIEFDAKGLWKEIDSEHGVSIPQSLIPATIRTYLKLNFQGRPVMNLERNSRGFEVEIDNGQELKFDKNGNLVAIDD